MALLLSGASSCQSAPKVSRCIVGDVGLICFDPRLPKDQQAYDLTFKEAVNYIATSPDDYHTLEVWMAGHCK